MVKKYTKSVKKFRINAGYLNFLYQVSWMRRTGEDNPYLLTYGKLIYSSDVRYQIFHEAGHDWKLQIQVRYYFLNKVRILIFMNHLDFPPTY